MVMRFDEWVRSQGVDPDPRFSLANERTFLSWITTSLGFLGVGLAVFTISPVRTPALTAISAAWILVATALALRAVLRWFRIERAIRSSQPLPVSASIPLVALALAVLSVSSAVALYQAGL